MAPLTGGLFVSCQVIPPSCDAAMSALLFEDKSPPPTTPLCESRKATLTPPALAELTSGVSYAFHVLPPSVVASILAMVAPPVAIHALPRPSVVMQVPLAANEASPDNAGGMLLAILCQVVPLVVRISGNTPFTESLCVTPRFGLQKAKQS